MTPEQRQVWSRLELAVGEASAVGELDLCRVLWPSETEIGLGLGGGPRGKLMMSLRRRVRRLVELLRLEENCPVLDSKRGYFLAADDAESARFCRSRHRRGITSLVIESIVRKQSPLETGLQRFFDFLKSEEDRRRRLAERRGKTFQPLTTEDVIAAVTEKAKSFHHQVADAPKPLWRRRGHQDHQGGGQ